MTVVDEGETLFVIPKVKFSLRFKAIKLCYNAAKQEYEVINVRIKN